MENWLHDKWQDFIADLRNSHKSLTIWFGVMSEFLIEYLPEITKAITESEDYMLPETYKRVMQGIVLLNMVLRFKTKSAMRHK